VHDIEIKTIFKKIEKENKDFFNISICSFSYRNSELVQLLQKKGSSTKSNDEIKQKKINKKINALIKKDG